ncbi:cyclophilin-like fold protein [Nocardioides sp. cx-173]|uniref:cyclophilin-like fold protein n=1 Tax=Nocardioides sp. cx-173 TaxID=2898796 RepID=UPI001E3C8F20|nr:cyclophilin-like fold protein [Nocardioides sp. cx-173]MCD4523378.1 hypothetical protein [Nocardioides sp. cx-173]UGB42283.1 hypothetical protein LQ940_01845 [Nocardioides sp. cx-173]
MSLPRAVRATVLAAVVVVVGAGCGDGGSSGDAPQTAASAPGAPMTSPSTGRSDAAEEESSMRIQITIGKQRFDATLTESAATRDLVAQLPVTIEMVDHGGVEKTGPLPAPLALDGQPDGADPDIGDVGYYAPGSDLVLYYGDQSYFPGIVVLGRLGGGAAEQIASIEGPVTATIEVP